MSSDHPPGGEPPLPGKRSFDDHRFRKGKSGNPRGRPKKDDGKKVVPAAPSSHDRVITEIMQREYPQKDGSVITLLAASIAQLGRAAGQSTAPDHPGTSKRPTPNIAAIKLLLQEHRRSSDADSAFRLAWLEAAIQYKINAEQVLEHYRRQRGPLPDIVPHPAHIDLFAPDGPTINGPVNREGQRAWELLKYWIRRSAAQEAEFRQLLKDDPGNLDNLAELKRIQSERRAYMRQVPKGWNWREKIVTRDSKPDALVDTLRLLGLFDNDPRIRGYLLTDYAKQW